MPDWLKIVLIVLGVVLLVAGGLYLAGKKELAKKILLPFTAFVALFAIVAKAFGGGTSAIREENERIKRELKQIEAERDALRTKIAERTQAFEAQRAALQEQIRENDARAATLKGRIETMEQQGAEAWFRNLPPEKRQEILKEVDRPGMPDEFRNPQ